MLCVYSLLKYYIIVFLQSGGNAICAYSDYSIKAEPGDFCLGLSVLSFHNDNTLQLSNTPKQAISPKKKRIRKKRGTNVSVSASF